MNRAKTSFSTEIFAAAITSMIQYVAPLQYTQSLSTYGKKKTYRWNGRVYAPEACTAVINGAAVPMVEFED
jgi:mannitol-specific phosphotransferase system IIBC component